MGDAERWSWRWLFDGEQKGAVRQWLFALAIAVFGIAAVVVTRGRQAAPLTVVAIFLGYVLWQPFTGVSRLDGQLRGTTRPSRRPDVPVQRRPRSWYRILFGAAVAWVAVELLIVVAIVRIPDRGFWWFLGLAGASIMVVAAAISALAAWRVQRAPAGPDPEPGAA